MKSLQNRLLIGTALGTVAVLFVAGVSIYALVKSSLMSTFDTSLLEEANTLVSLIEQEGEHIDLEFAEADMMEFRRAQRPEYFELRFFGGAVIERSPSLQGGDLPGLEGIGEPLIAPILLPDGRAGRGIAVKFSPRIDEETEAIAPAKPLLFVLAKDTQEIDTALSGLRFALLLVGFFATLSTVLILAFLVRVGLRPASLLAQEISEINEHRLSTRISLSKTPKELAPIVARLNALLERLEQAFSREKTLTADISHELRTPLSGLRTTLEVALSREREAPSYRETLVDCLTICKQAQSLVESLLMLARLDAGADPIHRQATNLKALLEETWRPFQKTAQEKKLRVNWLLSEPLQIDTDPAKLRLVVTNLFENAAHYAEPGGEITVSASQLSGATEIIISNSGSKISAQETSRVFERFWRGDQARESEGHCGIGLALCKTITELLGGSLGASSQQGGLFSIKLRL